MPDRLLVINAGSSSLKFGVYDLPGDDADLIRRCRGQIADIGAKPLFSASDGADQAMTATTAPLPAVPTHAAALNFLFGWLQEAGIGDGYFRALEAARQDDAPTDGWQPVDEDALRALMLMRQRGEAP